MWNSNNIVKYVYNRDSEKNEIMSLVYEHWWKSKTYKNFIDELFKIVFFKKLSVTGKCLWIEYLLYYGGVFLTLFLKLRRSFSQSLTILWLILPLIDYNNSDDYCVWYNDRQSNKS